MTGPERTFPIRLDDHVRTVPWAMLEPHEPQVWANHKRSLVQLAAAGGLTPEEAVAILEDRPFERMPMTTATLILKSFVSAWVGDIPPAVPASPRKEDRISHGVSLLERLRDGKAVPHRAHYNELIAILEACK